MGAGTGAFAKARPAAPLGSPDSPGAEGPSGGEVADGEPGWEDQPDRARKGQANWTQAPLKVIGAAPVAPEEPGPLDKFIRVFRLDELAAKCLRALQDDEAAFVIEACQGRLKFAKNPSAVVMTSIKGVAARVGRRY